MPKVSIIIPSYNRFNYLKECIHSLQIQTFRDFETIIVDDGSTPETLNQIQKICSKANNCNFFVRNRFPAGASTCRNIGLEQAKGEYIIFLDSDDQLAPHCLEQRVEAMEQNPQLDFSVFPMLLFYNKPGDSKFLWNRQTNEPDIDRFLRLDTLWQTTGPIWRKEALDKIGGFNESLACWQDVELHLKAFFANLKYKIVEDARPDAYYRKHNNGSISQQNLNDPGKIDSRIKLFNWAYLQTITTGLVEQTSTRKALRQMFLKIGFSLGSTLNPILLFKQIKKPENRNLLHKSDISALILNALLFYIRLYKLKKLFYNCNKNRIQKRLKPTTIGKFKSREPVNQL